jgi:hypothetical protein
MFKKLKNGAYLDVMYSFYFVFIWFVDLLFIFDIKPSLACAYSVLKDNVKLLWFSLFGCSLFNCTLHWGVWICLLF